MRRSHQRLFAFLLLAFLAVSALGIPGACPEGCDDLTDCGAFCLGCVCCPNGSSTPGEPRVLVTRLASREAAPGGVAASERDEPVIDILHVPRLVPA